MTFIKGRTPILKSSLAQPVGLRLDACNAVS